MSKVIQTDVGFAFQRSVIGPDNSHHSLNQSDFLAWIVNSALESSWLGKNPLQMRCFL